MLKAPYSTFLSTGELIFLVKVVLKAFLNNENNVLVDIEANLGVKRGNLWRQFRLKYLFSIHIKEIKYLRTFRIRNIDNAPDYLL